MSEGEPHRDTSSSSMTSVTADPVDASVGSIEKLRIHRLLGGAQPSAVAFSQDSQTVAQARENAVALYDWQSLDQFKVMHGPRGTISSLAFSDDDAYLAAGLWGETELPAYANVRHKENLIVDRTVWLWRVADGEVIRRYYGHRDRVLAIDFSTHGRRFVSGARDGEARVWDMDSSTCLRVITGHRGAINAVAVSSDGKMALTGGQDAKAILCDVDSGSVIAVFGHARPVYCVAFSPDGKLAITGSGDYFIRVWSTVSGRQLMTLPISRKRPPARSDVIETVTPPQAPTHASFSDDGASLCVGLFNGSRWKFRMSDGSVVQRNDGPREGGIFSTPFCAIAFSRDAMKSAQIAKYPSFQLDRDKNIGYVHYWDQSSSTERGIREEALEVQSIAQAPDGQHIAIGTYYAAWSLWNTETGRRVHRYCFQDESGPQVNGLAFLDGVKRMLASSWGGRLRIWDVERKRQLKARVLPIESVIFSMSGSASGRYALVGDGSRSAYLFDPEHFKIIEEFHSPQNGQGVRAVLSPDERYLLMSSKENRTLWGYVWDRTGGTKQPTELSEEQPPFMFTPDSTASVGGMRERAGVRIRNLVTHELVNEFAVSPHDDTSPGILDQVHCVEMSKDGRRLFLGTEDGRLQVFDVDSGTCLDSAQACRGPVTYLVLLSGDRRCVTVGTNGNIAVWDVPTPQ